MTESIYQFKLNRLDGSETTLEEYRGKVLLIVNTASFCGFTPQYGGLEALYRQYKEKGLVVLGFPCNQFGAQEPFGAEKIAHFCAANFDISFPMFAKIKVNGFNTHPLYRYLKSQQKGLLGTQAVKWNFTKFLVDRNGEVVARFPPSTPPSRIAETIKRYL